MASSTGPYSGANQPDYSVVRWDNGKPYYATGTGGKLYIPPASAMSMFDNPQALAWAKQQGYEIKGGLQGLTDASTGVVGPDGKTTYGASPVTMADQGGGLFKTTGTWNSQTGQFDHSTDWGNILTMVVAGGLTAGIATAMLGGGAAAETAVQTAVTTGSPQAGLAAGTAAAGGTLPATSGVTALGALAPGTAGSGAVAGALGTGAAAAPAAVATAAGGAGGLTSWLTGPTAGLIGTGINAFGQIYGATKQADASEAAAQLQAASFDKALAAAKEQQDYKRGQFASYQSRLQPFADSGYAASDRLSQFTGQPAAARTGMAAIPAGNPGTPAQTTGAPDVTLQAPDGTTKTVPAADVAFYLSRGAKRLDAPVSA